VVTKAAGVEKLKAVPMFSGLSQKTLSRLFDQASIVNHEAGHTIVKQGSGGVGFHLILDGEVKVVRGGKTINRLGPGKFFGEMTLIDDQPRSATVVAETPVESLTLSSWEFKPMVKNNPEMAWKLLVHLTGRLREEQSARDAAIS
jgi:CRP-like cAMP-binding protein